MSASRRLALRRLCAVGRTSPTALVVEPAEGDPPVGGGAVGDRRARAQADALVRGLLRRLGVVDAFLARDNLFRFNDTPDPIKWVLRLAAYEWMYQAGAPDYAIGQQAVELGRLAGGAGAARFINAMMRRLIPRLPRGPAALAADRYLAQMPETARLSVPPEVLREFREAYGAAEGEAVLAALAERPAPVWLRANLLKSTPEEVVEALRGEGVEAAADEGLPWALRWLGGEKLPWETDAFARGLFTIQDLGAMTATLATGAQTGERVLDACAAPGGKTGQLWEMIGGQGRLVALEVDAERRAVLAATLARLYGAGCGIEVVEFNEVAHFAVQPQYNQCFDLVVVDAPCQGLGLLRRHPEIRWDGRLGRREPVLALQRGLLAAAARCVRPGGRLVWITCSPTQAENEAMLGEFRRGHEGWVLEDPLVGLPPSCRGRIQVSGEGVARTRPDRADMDGFAWGCLRAPDRQYFE